MEETAAPEKKTRKPRITMTAEPSPVAPKKRKYTRHARPVYEAQWPITVLIHRGKKPEQVGAMSYSLEHGFLKITTGQSVVFISLSEITEFSVTQNYVMPQPSRPQWTAFSQAVNKEFPDAGFVGYNAPHPDAVPLGMTSMPVPAPEAPKIHANPFLAAARAAAGLDGAPVDDGRDPRANRARRLHSNTPVPVSEVIGEDGLPTRVNASIS